MSINHVDLVGSDLPIENIVLTLNAGLKRRDTNAGLKPTV